MTTLNSSTLAQGTNFGSLKEDVSNLVKKVDNDKTPLLSTMKMGAKPKVYQPDWLQQGLYARDLNPVAEGSSFTSVTLQGRQRLNNVLEITKRDFVISRTADELEAYGVSSELDWQGKLLLSSVHIDVDAKMSRYVAGGNAAITDATPMQKTASGNRKMGSVFNYVQNWLIADGGTANAVRGSTGTAVTENQSAKTTAGLSTFAATGDITRIIPTDAANWGSFTVQSVGGTAVSLTRNHFETAMERLELDGANPNMAMMENSLRTAASALFTTSSAAGAERRMTAMERRLNISLDGVITDFGFDIALKHSHTFSQHSGATGLVYICNTDNNSTRTLHPATLMVEPENDVSVDGRRARIIEECTAQFEAPQESCVILGVTA